MADSSKSSYFPFRPAHAVSDNGVIERPNRRSSLSLSQTLSLDTSPTPPADLEQIYASSCQTPGLTSFSLASPPSRSTEQLSLGSLYSRVKSVAAAAVRSAVGAHGGSKGGQVGSEIYRGNSGSRDSFLSAATGSDDLSGKGTAASPNKSQLPFRDDRKSRYAPGSPLTSGSRMSNSSSPDDLGSTSAFAPPAALRRVGLLANGAMDPSLAPITVFRDSSGYASGYASRSNSAMGTRSSTSHSPQISGGGRGGKGKEPQRSTVNALLGTTGAVVAGTAGCPPVPIRSAAEDGEGDDDDDDDNDDDDDDGGEARSRDEGSFFDEEFGSTMTDEEVISDSSDDGVVLLNSRLPGGHDVGKPANPRKRVSGSAVAKRPTPGPKPTSRDTNSPSRISTLNSSMAFPPTATGSKITTDPSHAFSSSHSPLSPPPGANPAATATKFPLSLPPQFDKNTTAQLPLPPPSLKSPPKLTLRRRKHLPPPMTRVSTDQSRFLPGFSIARDPSSDTESSRAATSNDGNHKESGGSSVYRQGFEDARTNSTASITGTGNSEAVNQALRQLRMGNLTRDFWMKDEVCKECFLCGSTFSAWRRKHHCRLCGQIFCSKCTTLITGDKFGHQGSMRVCNPCLTIVNGYQDESDSDEFSPASVFNSHQTTEEWSGSLAFGPTASSTSVGDPVTPFSMTKDMRLGATPMMAIPATRRTAGKNPNRRSQILEINAELPSPPRPSSVRSGKASMAPRPATAVSIKNTLGHHHHHHKHQHSRSHHRWLGSSSIINERAPFHRNPVDELGSERRLPAFHSDNIIDPDLAPYMSDDDFSDQEQMSIFATIAPKYPEGFGSNMAFSASVTVTQNEKAGDPSTGHKASKSSKPMPKNSGSINGMASVLAGSAGTGDPGSPVNNLLHSTRSTRKRNASFLSNLQPRPPTRSGKGHRLMRSLAGSVGDSSIFTGVGSNAMPSPRTSRTASMRGPLAPSIELNTASLNHVRTLLRQLLKDADIGEVDKWEKALMPILLKSTDDLNPDVRDGDSIDIRHYVKVKRIPGGDPGDTTYVSGVVFTKNLALKSMPRSVSQPRIVVITFPIEYQRHQQQLMSLEPVIAQEKEFLQNMVNRIIALHPTLLLVGKNISGFALQLLSQASIATAHLVKPSVIEAVARCAQAGIFSSVDKLALPHFKVGRCANFDVKTFVHEDIPGRKKTFMYFSGCPKELGCTIVLRGGDMGTLGVIKQITEMMVYVVYNLKLETCLMRDEFVNIPSTPATGAGPAPAGQTAAKPTAQAPTGATPVDSERAAALDGEPGKSEVSQPTSPPVHLPQGLSSSSLPDGPLPDDIPMPTYYEDMVRNHETKVLSASPFVKYMQPYLLMRARELERRLVYLRRLRDSQPVEEDEEDGPGTETEAEAEAETNIVLDSQIEARNKGKDKKDKPTEAFQLVQPEMVHGDIKNGTTKKMAEVLRAIHDAEYDKALHVYETQKKQWENYLSQYDDLFDPYAHQNIAVLYSLECTITTVPCEGPEIRRLEFYAQEIGLPLEKSDCALGQYVEYLCDTAYKTCASGTCDKKMIDHHRLYVHGQARVSVEVSKETTSPIQGMQGSILVWSCCRICTDAVTPAIPMSESTWKYSFGKYLELAFWSSEMKLKSGSCPHDLNRNHARCFGYRGLTVVFRYDPIELLEIVVPRTKIAYKPEIDLRIKNECYTQYEEKMNRFFSSVRSRLRSINIGSVCHDKIDACNAEIEALTTLADNEHLWLVKKLQEKYNKSKYFEIIPLNRALRALQERVVDWDARFSAFDRNYFPSEKDIRRLAALQLKSLFNDNSGAAIHSDNERMPGPSKEGKPAAVDGTTTPSEIASTPAEMSSKQAHDVLASVVEEDVESNLKEETEKQIISEMGKTEESIEVSKVSPESRRDSLDDGAPRQEMSLAQTAPVIPTTLEESGSNSPTALASPKPQSTPSIVDAINLEASVDLPRNTAHRPSIVSLVQNSLIPRPVEGRRKVPPPFVRTHSLPGAPQRKPETAGPTGSNPRPLTYTTSMSIKKASEPTKAKDKVKGDKKASERTRVGSLSTKKPQEKSQIPRSIPSLKRRDTKVSSLAKHFEQLSREFEKERAREKKQMQAKRSRALPVATSKPVVAVYRSVKEAVEELSDEEPLTESSTPCREPSNLTESTESTVTTVSPQEPLPPSSAIPCPIEPLEGQPEEIPVLPSQAQSDADLSEGEASLASDHETVPPPPSIADVLPPTLGATPLNEKRAWMKILSNFWAERSASGWSSLEYPLHPTDHVFNDSDVIIREDEPSSLIAFALNSQDYEMKLDSIRNSDNSSAPFSEKAAGPPASSEKSIRSHRSKAKDHPELERSLLKATGTHLKYQFQEGSAKMFCKIFYIEQFDALRRNCGVADRYVESLSRCVKWDSKGGKTKSVFLKTQDERIVLKALSPIETAAFIKFAPAYFQFMAEAFFHELPTVIAKMLGFYQISIKNPTTGTEIKWDVLVMENLFYDRKTTRIFDLKGSMRNRYTQSTGDQNEVLLDENMVEFIYESPLFVREHSKKLLRASLWNDTLFLSRQNVMDYSLMIGIDEARKELVVGIIDCIRTFTWDKMLESWVKEKGFGGKKPTVTSPREYKHRFREAMERYVLEAPSCWHLFRMGKYMGAVPVRLHPTTQSKDSTVLADTKDQADGRAAGEGE